MSQGKGTPPCPTPQAETMLHTPKAYGGKHGLPLPAEVERPYSPTGTEG